VSTAAIQACRAVWPRHTSKFMARKWGHAVITAKKWLARGIPEYQLQRILADLDEELARQEAELLRLRDEIRRARFEGSSARSGGVAAALGDESAAASRRLAAGGEE
jgi:hypothetical protein